MKSMFAPAAFGSSRMGFVPLQRPIAYRPARIGQDWLEDILEDVGLSDVENITEELDQLLSEVPIGSVRESYETERDECLAKSNIVSKYKCLYDLFQKIKREYKDGRREPPPQTTPPPRPEEPENGFPVVPVAIGGVVVAVIAYALLS